MRKSLFVYLDSLLIFGAGIFAALDRGKRMEGGRAAVPAIEASAPQTAPASGGLLGTLHNPLPLLLLQLITIVLTARLLGALFHRIGQPPVIGEIVAGILLGPSLLGAIAPGVSTFLFAPSSTGLLKLFAEIGVLLFLFAVGLELDVDRWRKAPLEGARLAGAG